MSLSFLVPAFLAGLAAIAIPVIIHLTRRQAQRTQEFPSLMFLARIPHESTSRRRIHRWPLLLMRCAALALLVFAFSRPFLDSGNAAVLTLEGVDREVVILLDRSYSMGYGDHWQRAVQAAREVVDGLRAGDRATLVLFDTGAEVVEESTASPGVLRSALSRVEPGARATRYAPALQYAQRVLSGSPLGQREITLISDFQRNAWDAEAGIIGQIRMPAGTVVTPVKVASGEVSNVTVASVSLQRSDAAVGHARHVTEPVQDAGQPPRVGVGGNPEVVMELHDLDRALAAGDPGWERRHGLHNVLGEHRREQVQVRLLVSVDVDAPAEHAVDDGHGRALVRRHAQTLFPVRRRRDVVSRHCAIL
jgi:hypothetical protein